MNRATLIVSLTVVAMFIMAGSAHAVLTGAKTIELIQNVSNTFQIAEVQAFETGTGTNVAFQGNGGVASATSSGFGTVPGDANDGNTNGNFGGGSVWHSGGTVGETLTVTLNPSADLDMITIYGRTDCCQGRQDDFDVVIRDASNNIIFQQQVLGLGTSPGAVGSIEFPSVVPEPATISLAALGMTALLRRKRRSA